MHNLIKRTAFIAEVQQYRRIFPVVALIGPRQCGKSTLARTLMKTIKNAEYFDLEDHKQQQYIQSDPSNFFSEKKDKTVCLDEIQNLPGLFSTMRSVIDRDRKNGKFIVLGSASPDLINKSSQSLAGRIGYIELTPFQIGEIFKNDHKNLTQHWLRGGFPESFLAPSEKESLKWRNHFIQTYCYRDIKVFAPKISSIHFRRLLDFLKVYHGQKLNYSSLAQSLEISKPTIINYIDLLEETYIVRRLYPFYNNAKKRLVKTPKIYIRDSGLLHALARIKNNATLRSDALLGPSFEGYVIENLINNFPEAEAYYYQDSNQSEIDLILRDGRKTVAVEIKHSTKGIFNRSGANALKIIKPNHTFIVTPHFQESFSFKKEYGPLTIGSLSQVIEMIKEIMV